MKHLLKIKNLKLKIFLHVLFPWKKLSKKKQRMIIGVALIILIVGLPVSFYILKHAGTASAAWFNENWGYRQAIPVTSTEGAAQNNVFVSFTLDTATLISNGKLQSNCQDIRITDANGNLLNYHVGRATACNNAATSIDFLLSSFPDGQSTYYVYYGNPGAPSTDVGALTVSQANTANLTVSGNEITDATRSAALQGDGVTSPDSSYGIWQGTTSLNTNGGFETNTTGWSIRGTGSIARITSAAKFGSASLETTVNANLDGTEFFGSGNASQNTAYTFSGWVKAKDASAVGKQITVFLEASGGTYENVSAPAITLTSSWQRFSTTYTWLNASHTGYGIAFREQTNQGGYPWAFDIDGVQYEQSSIATPYVETNGATANRNNAVVSGPFSVLNPTQGWVAARIRMARPAASAGNQYLFNIGTDVNNRIAARPSGSSWQIFNVVANNTSEFASQTLSYAAGDYMTMVAYWTKTNLAVSVNGASFTSANRTLGIQNAFTSFDIGSLYGNQLFFNGDILWATSGTGTLSNTDATTLYNMGNTDPTPSAVATLSGGLATPTFLWTADTTADTQTTYTQFPARNYTIGSLATTEVSPAPAVYFKFNENYGTTTKDSSPNGFVGTFGGGAAAPTWLTADNCISGPCLRFNGANYVNLPVAATQNIMSSRSAVTISAWVRIKSYPAAVSRVRIFNAYLATGATGYELGLYDGGNLEIGGRSNNADSFQTTTTTAPALNEWHFVTGILDYANNLKILYIDGVLKKSAAASWNSSAYTPATNINMDSLGSNGASEYFNGDVDDLKVYNYARTAAQIQADYNSRGSKAASAATFGSTINNQPSALSNGLIGYWKMDEATWSGTLNEVLDSSGNGNNGQAQGATGGKAYATSSAKFGNAGYFDGVDDYVSIPSNTIFNLASTNHTISAWFNTSTIPMINPGMIVQRFSGGSPGNGYYVAVTNTGAITYNERTDGGNDITINSTSTAYIDSQWHHVVVTVDVNSKTAKMYIDGQFANSDTYLGNLIDSSGNALTFGNRSSNPFPFPGKIDEVRIYNRALSPADVSMLYNWAPGPIAYYNFEEGKGSTVNDTSGNGSTGSWNGTAPYWAQGKYGWGGSFNGINDYVSLGNPAALNFGTQSFTYGMWVYVKSNTSAFDMPIWKGGNSAVNAGFDMELGSGAWTANVSDGNTLKSINFAASGVTNTWVYLTAVVDKQNNRLNAYYNGNLASSTDISAIGGSVSSGVNGYLGTYSAGNNYFFNGTIDDVKFYNYARTQKQIVSDMNAGHPNVGSPVGSPLGWWRFDEGNNTTVTNFGNGSAGINGSFGAGAAAPTWSTDAKFGKALNFNGTSQYVTLGNIAAMKIATRSATFWAKPSASITGVTQGIISAGAASNWYLGFSATNRMIMSYGNAALAQVTPSTATNVVIPNQWHHYGYVFEETATADVTTKFYRDGVLISSATTTAHAGVSSLYGNGFLLGSYGTASNYYAGLLDEVRFYNYALTDDEMRLDYNHSSSVQMGSFSDTSGLTGGNVASNSASAIYCVPGDTSTCSAPVGEWNFEEKSGNAQDTSGNGYSGSIGSTTRHISGKVGAALDFDGTANAYVNLSDNLDLIGSPMSISVWVKPRSFTTFAGIVAKMSSAGNYMIRIADTLGNIQFLIRDVTTAVESLSTTTPIPLNKWTHIEVIYDNATTAIIYYNGIQVATKTNFTLTRGDTAQQLELGYNPLNAAGLNGSMDQVRIYNYVRTPAQVALDYNRGAPVGYWRLDDCQGSSVIDSSGNGNAGTISGSTAVGTCTDGTGTTKWSKGATGKFNSSLYFDGSSDYITVPHNTNYNSLPLTVSAWIKPTGTGTNGYIVSKYLNGSNNGYMLYRTTNNTICFLYFHDFSNKNYNNDTTDCSVLTAPINQWTHVMGVLDSSGTIYIYINGVLSRTKSWATGSALVTTTTENVTLGALRTGAGTYAAYVNGLIDDVRIYNYNLTLSQIRMVYNQGAAVRYGPLTGAP